MAAMPLSLTVDTSVAQRSWRSSVLSLLSSLLFQCLALSALVIAPLLSLGTMPEPDERLFLPKFVPVVMVPKPPPAAAIGRRAASPKMDFSRLTSTMVAPVAIPDEITEETVSLEDSFPWVDIGVPGGDSAATKESWTPPPKDLDLPTAPIVVGGEVRPPRMIHQVSPVYPLIAIQARVQGTVVIQAIIDADGNVSNLTVTRSIPLLDEAAVEAVRQWKYEPTYLNGRPVAVVMSVNVDFRLIR